MQIYIYIYIHISATAFFSMGLYLLIHFALITNEQDKNTNYKNDNDCWHHNVVT